MARTYRNRYGHTLRYTGIFGGVQVMKIGIDVVRNKLTALLLRSAGMGLNAIFMNIAEVVNSLTNFGLRFSSVQHLSELLEGGDEAEMRRFVKAVRSWSLCSALIAGALCLALCQWLSNYYFEDQGAHSLDVALLSLFVASMPIEEGECSILKGVRKLRRIAGVEIMSATSTFLLTVPLYWLFGVRGIVASLVLCGWSKAGIHIWAATRIFPYRANPFSREVMRLGLPLILKGVPYMLAAIFGGLTTTMLFRYCLNGEESEIGLYKAAFSMMVVYAGMVFVAVEADYFPRLSSAHHDRVRQNQTICEQIDVSTQLITPLLIAFAMGMPWVIRLLYSQEFLSVVRMSQIAVFYMFFKAVTTPVAYVSLAHGRSIVYLAVEMLYNLAFVGLMYVGYHAYGLIGAGAALALSSLFDMALVCTTYGALFGVRLSRGTLRIVGQQGLLLALSVAACLPGSALLKYGVSLPALALRALCAWKTLGRRS